MVKKVNDFLSGIHMTVLAGIFLTISLVMMLTGTQPAVDPAWLTIVICGVPLAYLALHRLVLQRWVSSALLITVAMVASIFIGELFAAGEVAFIMAIGAILEDYTVRRAHKGMDQLVRLAPVQARRIAAPNDPGQGQLVNVSDIGIGELLRVLPGESIPVDGEIVFGNTSVDQSVMTGESLPADKQPGDHVFCGTVNCYGSIDIRAERVGEDSSLQKMICLVREAESRQAPMQRIADRWATWLVPIALLIAVGAYLVTRELSRAVTVLVVFCPCALALATPTSVIAAIGQAAKHGVLIKSGEALEKMGKVDCVAMDKTGTLTHGTLEVSDLVPAGVVNDTDLLRCAAAAELRSEHPMGKAIVRCADARGLTPQTPEAFQMLPGKGVRATVNGKTVLCGSLDFLLQNGISIPQITAERLSGLQAQGKAAILVAQEQDCMGVIALADSIRPAAEGTVKQLEQSGADTLLLTGDNSSTARYFAERVGVRQVHAQLLPEDKVAIIRELQVQGRTVCMIGDGVNDAAALKTADVGIAMGTIGSDIATEAADIALMGDCIEKLPYVRRLAKSTVRTIQFNIALSMTINFFAVLFSVLGALTPVTGAIVHNAGSVLVVLNAAMLYDRKFDTGYPPVVDKSARE